MKRGKPRELYLNSPAIISYRKFPFYLILSQNFQTLESTFLILEIHQFLDFPQPLAKKFRCRLPRTKGFAKFWFKGWKYGPKIYSIYVIIYHVLLVSKHTKITMHPISSLLGVLDILCRVDFFIKHEKKLLAIHYYCARPFNNTRQLILSTLSRCARSTI